MPIGPIVVRQNAQTHKPPLIPSSFLPDPPLFPAQRRPNVRQMHNIMKKTRKNPARNGGISLFFCQKKLTIFCHTQIGREMPERDSKSLYALQTKKIGKTLAIQSSF